MLSLRTVTFSLLPSRGEPPLSNPLIGFAPRARYTELAEAAQLVFMNVTWRELEPQRGIFDFEVFEEKHDLARWRAEGKRVVFRFVCDNPGREEHMDIPDWLYLETGGAGDFYDTDYGKGYAPDYENEIFISRHGEVIEALGSRYGGDDFFFYIELGSLGHWGEWHVKRGENIRTFPLQETRELYVLHYLESFPNSRLLMRRPFSQALEYNLGVYNDMTGDLPSTERWLSWLMEGGEFTQTGEKNGLVPIPEIWKSAPVGGEFAGSDVLPLITDDLGQTLELLRRSHMSFIGPKVVELSDRELYPGNTKSILLEIGYRLYIPEARFEYSKRENSLTAEIDFTNEGACPFYGSWPVRLFLFDEQGGLALESSVDISLPEIIDESPVTGLAKADISSLPKGVYSVGIGIIDPITGKPAVDLAISGGREDHIFILGEITL